MELLRQLWSGQPAAGGAAPRADARPHLSLEASMRRMRAAGPGLGRDGAAGPSDLGVDQGRDQRPLLAGLPVVVVAALTFTRSICHPDPTGRRRRIRHRRRLRVWRISEAADSAAFVIIV